MQNPYMLMLVDAAKRVLAAQYLSRVSPERELAFYDLRFAVEQAEQRMRDMETEDDGNEDDGYEH